MNYSTSLYETATGRWWLPNEIESDIVIQAMREGLVFEPEVVEAVGQFAKPGDTILDVGSNFGQMAVLFSRMVGENGKVHAFEAEPFIAETLRRNLNENQCHNVTVHEMAIWNESGHDLIYPEADFDKFGSFGSFGIDPRLGEGRAIKSRTIDSLDLKGPIRVMKFDIQGSDLNAMIGAAGTIYRNKPAIIFEYDVHVEDQFPTRLPDYMNFVNDINYVVQSEFAHNYVIVPK